MNIIFLTMNPFTGTDMHNIYADLMLEIIRNGHKPYIVTPREKKTGEVTELEDRGDYAILKVQIGNTANVSLIEKGISTVRLEALYKKAITKHLTDIKFDLILYSTPPVTFVNVIRWLKKRNCAASYLMLKDIFPQNAVDLGMFSEQGLLHRYFRNKEKRLYRISDHIGCMSKANRDYLLTHNPELDSNKTEICPNAIYNRELSISTAEKKAIRNKHGIPDDRIVFIYGGNLGKPQGIPFFLSCLEGLKERNDVFFVIAGSGTEYASVEQGIKCGRVNHIKLIPYLPAIEYERLTGACDAGLILLDCRFTIPNYPSRLLSYMQAGVPVFAATDPCTDLGDFIVNEGFGWWCESRDPRKFVEVLDRIIGQKDFFTEMGAKGNRLLSEKLSPEIVYHIIMDHYTT